MPGGNKEPRYGWFYYFQTMTTVFAYSLPNRYQGNRTSEAHLSRDVWTRHVMGLFPYLRGYVVTKISTETSRLSRSYSKLQARHRSSNVSNKSPQEGCALYSCCWTHQLTLLIGPHFFTPLHCVATSVNATSYHHTGTSYVIIVRSSPAVEPFSCIGSKEDHCYPLSVGSSLSRNTSTCMAKD